MDEVTGVCALSMCGMEFCCPDMVGKVDGADMDPDEGKGGRLSSYGGGGKPARGVAYDCDVEEA